MILGGTLSYLSQKAEASLGYGFTETDPQESDNDNGNVFRARVSHDASSDFSFGVSSFNPALGFRYFIGK
jgi:hypothetical protein